MSTGIVCFGRGIEKSWASDLTGMYWNPTAYLEKLTPDRQHSGFLTKGLQLNSDDESVVIAGAYANAMATAQLFEEASTVGRAPRLITWAAGRPNYLKNEPPEISEGSILFDAFKDRVRYTLNETRVEFQTQNKNTRDDLLQSLTMAKEMGLTKLFIISVFVHLCRIGEFYRYALRERPDFASVQVEFRASELMLLGKGSVQNKLLLLDDTEVKDNFDDMAWARIVESPVYRRTAAMEAKGIVDLRAGRYKFS